MAAKKRGRRVNLLADKKATVALHRNGLTIQIDEVPAPDCAQVGQALLDAMRQMVDAGYDELRPDGGSYHSGPLGEVPEEAEMEEGKGRIGFR